MKGCKKCPAFDKCTVTYRGSACEALRGSYGIDTDPEILTNMDYNKLIEDLHDTAKLQIGMYHTQNEEIIESAAECIKELISRSEKAEIERDAAVEQLHGYCAACKHYTPNHCEGPCDSCKHEYYQYVDHNAKDNWQWRGIKEE